MSTPLNAPAAALNTTHKNQGSFKLNPQNKATPAPSAY